MQTNGTLKVKKVMEIISLLEQLLLTQREGSHDSRERNKEV